MKTKTHNILGTLNLLLFLCSFTLFTINGFASQGQRGAADHLHQKVFEKANDNSDDSSSSSQQLSEKNETETENVFEAQALVLPLFFSYFQFEISHISYSSAQPLAEKLCNPIYISVCNFRI